MFNVEISRARYLTFRSRICIWFGSSVWFLSCDDDDVRMCGFKSMLEFMDIVYNRWILLRLR